MSAKIQDVQAIWDARVERLGEYATDRIGSTKEEKDAERVQRFNFIKEQLPDGLGFVVDYGCGTGLMCEMFHPDTYLGIDISPKMIEMAKEKYTKYNFQTIDHTINKSDIAFADTLFIATVLQHNTEKTVKEILTKFKHVQNVIVYENTDNKLKDTENCAYRTEQWYRTMIYSCIDTGNGMINDHIIHGQTHSCMIFKQVWP